MFTRMFLISSVDKKSTTTKKIHGKAFVKGELVWLHNPVVKKDHSHKLHKPWEWPIQSVSEALRCELSDPTSNKLQEESCSL